MSHDLFRLRRRHMLTQLELADLLDISQAAVGRLEDDKKSSSKHLRLRTAFALHVVFGKNPHRLFTSLLQEVEDAVMLRGAELDRKLDGKQDSASRHKRALLAEMVRRASNRSAA